MNPSITSDHDPTYWTSTTFEFLCDTLRDEVHNHPHKDELMRLMHEQIKDDSD